MTALVEAAVQPFKAEPADPLRAAALAAV